MRHPLSRQERAALARALRSPDPLVRKQAQGTRALIEDQIIERIMAGEAVSLRGLDQRSRALIEAAVKARSGPSGRPSKPEPGKDVANPVAIPLKDDLQNGPTAVGAAAYWLGREIYESIRAGRR